MGISISGPAGLVYGDGCGDGDRSRGRSAAGGRTSLDDGMVSEDRGTSGGAQKAAAEGVADDDVSVWVNQLSAPRNRRGRTWHGRMPQ